MQVLLLLVILMAAADCIFVYLPASIHAHWFEIRWPSDIKPEHAMRLLRQIAADQRSYPLLLEARATEGKVTFLLGVEEQYAEHVRNLVQSLVPDATIRHARYARKPVNMAVKFTMNTWQRALQADRAEHTTAGVLAALTAAGANEELVLQIMLGPRRVPLAIAPDAPSGSGIPWWRLALYGKPSKVDIDKHNTLKTKVSDHGFATTIRLGTTASTGKRMRELLLSLASGLRTSESPGTHLRVKNENPKNCNEYRQPLRWPPRLNVAELTGLTGWPLSDAVLSGVGRDRPHALWADPLVSSSGRIIARATAPGDTHMLGLSPRDALQHLHVLGPTGVGKSTLLMNMICQDIDAGRGTIVIDPKGDLIADVLERIPLHR